MEMEPQQTSLSVQDFRQLTIADLHCEDRRTKPSNAHCLQNKLLTSQMPTKQFLQEFENYSSSSQLALLTHIKQILVDVPTNAQILSNNEVIQTIINLCLNTTGKIQEELLSIADHLFKCSSLHDDFLRWLLRKIVCQFNESKVVMHTLLTGCNLLSSLYENKAVASNEPKNVMYFHGHNDFKLENGKGVFQWPFYKGYTVGMWLYLEQVRHQPDMPLSKLYTFYAEGSGGIEAYFIDDKLFYRVLGANYTEPHIGSNGLYLCSIERKKWHFIAIEHEQSKTLSRSKLNVFLDKKVVNTVNIDPPKPSTKAKTKIVFFDGLYCRSSSICLFLSTIGLKIEELSKNVNSIDYLKDQKALVFEPRGGKVYERGGFAWSNVATLVRNRKMNCSHILPFFYLASFLKPSASQPILDKILHLVVIFLRSSKENQVQAERAHFMKILSSLMMSIPEEFFGDKIFNVLLHIKSCITQQKLLDQFICYFLWKLLRSKAPIDKKLEVFQLIKNCFTQNLIHNSTQLGFDEVLSLMVDLEPRGIECCQKHQRAIQPQMQTPIMNKQEELLQGLRQFMELLFSNPKIDLSIQVPKIIRLFYMRYSPCFITKLLSMLRKLITDRLSDKLSQENIKKTLKGLAEKKAHLVFMHLIANSPFVDVKADSLRMIYFLLSCRVNIGSQAELSVYISQVLWKIHELPTQKSVAKEVPEIRKVSSTPEVEQEGPQAPSMSNRRNASIKFTFGEMKGTVMEEEKTVDPDVKPKEKKKFLLNIDTDKINELYSYGGQKGKQVVMDQEDEDEELENIRQLAKKCIKAMHSSVRKQEIHTVKENKKIGFPVAPLNSTRNQDLTSGNRQRGFPTNLRIIEESEKSASQKKSRRMSDFSEDETRRTPSKSPSQRKQENQNMLILYSALLECTFQKEIGKVIAPSPRIASISCFEMTMAWGLNCSNEIKVLILTDLIIMLEQKVNLDIVSGNKELLNFVMDTIYCALASSSEELLKLASGLLNTIHQKVFLTDTDAIMKFSHIFNWPVSNEKLSDFRDPNLQLLTVRYCWYVVLQSTADALNNDNSETLWETNFSILCLLTEQLVYSNYNYGATAVERREENGLSYLVSSSQVPVLVRQKFPYDWIDYTIVVKLQQIFNKYFTTKSFENIKRNAGQKFIENSLDNKNNLEILRDSEFYLNSQQARGIILPLCHLYSSFVEFSYENHLDCQNEEVELVSLGKLLLILAEVMHFKNASGKRSQIIEAFMVVLKTSVCICRNLQLMMFFITVKNFITSRYVQPGVIDPNCPLNLVCLEIANMKFPGKTNFMDATKYPSIELDLRIFLEEIEVQLPPKIVDKKELQLQVNQKEIIQRLEDQMLDLRTSTSEAQRQRHSAMTIIEEAGHRRLLSLFKKAWKKMRSYNEVWVHPNFYFQVDTLYNKNVWNYDKQQPARPYKIRVNKQQSKSKARFLLEAKLVEPKMVLEREQSQKLKGVINFDKALIGLSKLLGEAEGKGQHQISSKFLSLGKCLVELFHPLRTDVDSPLTLKRVDLITTLTARAGYIGITAEKLVFVYMYYEQRDSHLAIVKHRLRPTCNFTKEWPLQFIKQVYRRRYVNKRSALEIFFLNGESVFLNFPEGDCEQFSKKVVKLRQTKSPNLTYFKTLDPKKIIEGSNIVKRWDKYEMSNFEYIMSLNCLSGRSYKDVSQYHVFPWTLTSFAQKLDLTNPNSYRDFSRNMGSMGSETRVNMFETRYENFDPHMDGHKFHFGTHYSSPGIIYHYLVRLSPFTEGAIELQSGRFDLPDRLFFSIEDSFKNCTTEYSDVRQLIPQFFILPEMFLNEQKYDLGVMQSKKRVNNVELPQWAHDNPYLYVMKLRRAFEMQYVSRNINKWIDLIFGYRQKGEEAIKAMNVFFHLTYEDSVNFQTMSDMKMKKAIETQIINFGQTPSQLFSEPHPPRKEYPNCQKLITVPNINPKIYRPTNKNAGERKIEVNPMKHTAESLIRLKWIKDSKLISVNRGGRVIYYKWYSQGLNRIPFKCAIEDEKQLEKLSKNKYDPTEYYDPSLELDNFPLQVICSGVYILIGGIAQGKLLQIEAETGNLLERYKNHNDSITCIKSDTRDNFVMTGDAGGDIILWRITPQGKLSIIQKMSDHCLKVNSIFISNELKSFVSCSEDGSVNMYNIITGKKIRSYRHPEGKPINNVIVSTCPLAVLIMFCNRDRMIFCYSINGQLIQRVHEVDSAHLLVPTLIKDMRSLQYVVYGNEKGEIFIRDLPFLDYPRKFTVAKDATITNICISKDLRYIICSCSDGEMSVITDPSEKTN